MRVQIKFKSNQVYSLNHNTLDMENTHDMEQMIHRPIMHAHIKQEPTHRQLKMSLLSNDYMHVAVMPCGLGS